MEQTNSNKGSARAVFMRSSEPGELRCGWDNRLIACKMSSFYWSYTLKKERIHLLVAKAIE
jgi:hypothetical protein